MKTVKKFAPYNAQYMTYVENYFSDMADKGLFLKRWSAIFAEFEVGEPEKVRYRIVPKSVEKEEIDIFNGSGWEYVCTKSVFGELSVFCTDDESAPELFTDMGSYKAYMKKFTRSCLWNILLIPIMLFVMFLNLNDTRISFDGPLHYFEDPVFCMLDVSIALIFIYWLMHLIFDIRIYMQIKRGLQVIRNKSYKRVLGIHKGILIICMISLVMSFTGVPGISRADDLIEKFDQPVSLKELDADAWNSIESVLNNNDGSDDYKVFYEIDERHEMWMDAIDVYTDYEENTVYRAHYYEFKSERLAEKWLDEEIAYNIKQDLTYNKETIPDIIIDDSAKQIWKLGLEDEIRVPSDEVDYMGYYESGGGQDLFIRDGKKIEIVGYAGSEKLLEHVDLFIEDIKE